MKKFLIIAAVILIVLIIVDRTVLKDKGIIQQAKIEKYEEIENIGELPVGLKEGELAPEIELVDINGDSFKLSDYKGKAVLLNFWASWCGPCEAEMPYMEKLHKKYQEDDIEIIAVNMTRSEKVNDAPEKFVEKHDLTFTIPMDQEGVASKDYEIMAYPTSYFIDSDGVIRNKVLGALNEEYMEKELLRLP
ncbi:thiol-disulfide isomerase/thioredoxin [Cytobacillus horneckiae]|uniref:TlpA family protein disulfide reductase n=1 Tax=Cytobacillus horneckiae TaxID=549687 RepID=A0A2N0ZL56_9BACI|nr:TlpA disulfide reductase family protein [Cytobacillus horneckiae]MBN6885678.1 TlpA family protein disulfide reductase [Cytobacillus horneckiae]MEC1156211.1 TlpA disulfide reductase family protein [Cytobacillus horneckiae]MED2938229.1 TlpA disulfide reductase family protein [Cytobacillus horneckiae]PKG30247.1 TlpA family protein disulfide reductase [Cytobacillus horneckiae]